MSPIGCVNNQRTFAMLRNAFAERTDVVWDDKLLVSPGLVTSDGLLTNAGLLFADYCNLRHSQIYCTRWNGLEKDNAINDSEYQGKYSKTLVQTATIPSELP